MTMRTVVVKKLVNTLVAILIIPLIISIHG